jgi:hypothetical protein
LWRKFKSEPFLFVSLRLRKKKFALSEASNLSALKSAEPAGFVDGSKAELGALKARQIIARGEASEASAPPWTLGKIDASPEWAVDFSLSHL